MLRWVAMVIKDFEDNLFEADGSEDDDDELTEEDQISEIEFLL